MQACFIWVRQRTSKEDDRGWIERNKGMVLLQTGRGPRDHGWKIREREGEISRYVYVMYGNLNPHCVPYRCASINYVNKNTKGEGDWKRREGRKEIKERNNLHCAHEPIPPNDYKLHVLQYILMKNKKEAPESSLVSSVTWTHPRRCHLQARKRPLTEVSCWHLDFVLASLQKCEKQISVIVNYLTLLFCDYRPHELRNLAFNQQKKTTDFKPMKFLKKFKIAAKFTTSYEKT